MLSWVVPSTKYVLQQSFDLISWTTVTNTPVLNLTNLQNEVTATEQRAGLLPAQLFLIRFVVGLMSAHAERGDYVAGAARVAARFS